jgi:putative hydrolase of the HAD superfamily
MPEWIFFDVGWTLVDEAPALLDYFESVRRAMPNPGGATARDLYARYRFAIREDAPDPRARVLEEAGLPGGDWKRFGWNYDLVRPYRDASPALRALRGTVKLGVLANQGPGLPERLDRWGFAGLFDLVLGSGDCGVKKPSPEIFALAAERAGSPPTSLMMAGDRLDNDIAPAKRAGWQTVWVRRGDHGKLEPRDPAETPDRIVGNLVRLAGLFVPADRITLAERLDGAGAGTGG